MLQRQRRAAVDEEDGRLSVRVDRYVIGPINRAIGRDGRQRGSIQDNSSKANLKRERPTTLALKVRELCAQLSCLPGIARIRDHRGRSGSQSRGEKQSNANNDATTLHPGKLAKVQSPASARIRSRQTARAEASAKKNAPAFDWSNAGAILGKSY